jgi:hypothetical protein
MRPDRPCGPIEKQDCILVSVTQFYGHFRYIDILGYEGFNEDCDFIYPLFCLDQLVFAYDLFNLEIAA